MWNSYWSGRTRRDLPRPNYNESSEDEYDSPLVSPSRPVNTRAGSPVELAIPTLNDNVDEDLEQVQSILLNTGHTPLFRREQPDGAAEASVSEDLPESEVVDEDFVEGVGSVEVSNMPDPVVVAFEDENGADEARALQEACRQLEKFEFDLSDLDFTFNQAEIKMSAVGVKKQYTKLQALSTILPKQVIDQVKKLLRKKLTTPTTILIKNSRQKSFVFSAQDPKQPLKWLSVGYSPEDPLIWPGPW